MRFGGRQLGLKSITEKYLMICEGMHEVECFTNLCTQRSINNFQVAATGYIAGAPPNRDGIDYLTSALDALPAIPYFDDLDAILITADNNGAPARL
jgi:hypothetical protein